MRTAGGLRRPILLGIAAVAGYVVVTLATLGGGTHVRPLFDGFSPPPPYRWVNPPKAFAAANVKPASAAADVALGVDGSEIRGVATDDGQFVLSLPPGAIAPREGETGAKVEVTPLDPASLGPLPPGLRADGNAYRVTIAYQPSGQAVPPLVKPGNLVMNVPEVTEVLLYSKDGQAWTRLSTHNLAGPTTPDSTFDQAGYYLGATPPPAAQTPAKGSSGTGDRVVAVAVITVALAVGLWFLPALVRRVRHR